MSCQCFVFVVFFKSKLPAFSLIFVRSLWRTSVNGSHSFSFYTAVFWVSWIAGEFVFAELNKTTKKEHGVGRFFFNCFTNSLLFYFRLNRF